MMRIIKYGAFLLLTLVSAYLSINMFVNLGADMTGKVVLGIVALALESTKVFALLRIEYAMLQRSKNKTLRRPWSSIAIYLALALLSVIASLGFTLVTVDKQVESSRAVFSSVADDYSFDIEQLQASLVLIDAQAKVLQDQISRINPDFASGSVRLSTEAQELADRRSAVVASMSALKKQQREAVVAVAKSEEQNVYGMFVLMGNMLGVPDKLVMTSLLFLISLLLEIGMLYTSPTIEVAEEELHELVHTPIPLAPPAAEPAKKRAYVKKIKEAPEKFRERISVSAKASTASAVFEAASPHIITQQARPAVASEPSAKELLQKLLQPSKGTELKTSAQLAYELSLPVEKINEIFSMIAKIKGPSGPLMVQKDTAWHLNYMKDITIGIVLRSPAIISLLKGLEYVSKAK